MGSSQKNGSADKNRSNTPINAFDSAEQRYRIEANIGIGATSRVYRAWDSRDRREVALKILDSEITEEWETLASLSSQQCIVRLFERGRIADPLDPSIERFFISMELLEGSSLDKKPPVLRELGVAKQIIQGCCRALAAAHERRIIHCDIKPSNVFLNVLKTGDYSGVTVLDFGLASRLSSDSIRGGAGTYAYMSPEQISGEQVIEASDIFSLGVLSYEILTDRHPFVKDAKTATADELRALIPEVIPVAIQELNPAVPESVALTVHRALAKEPLERPSSLQMLQFLDQREVLPVERRQAEKELIGIRAAFDKRDFVQASRKLRVLERRGLAFAEIVLLRHQIDASQQDEDVIRHTAEARRFLDSYELSSARQELAIPQRIPSRRFDVRVLEVEAELEFRARELAEADDLQTEAQRAFETGLPRKAEWLLRRRENLGFASPFSLAKHWNPTEADGVAEKIRNFYTDENERLGQGLESLPADADGVTATTPAVVARELQLRAGRHKPLLEKALQVLGISEVEEQARVVQELEQMRSADLIDPVEDIVALIHSRKEIVDTLRRQLSECQAANDIPGVLQAIESLRNIVPIRDLSSDHKQAQERWEDQLAEDMRSVLLRNLEFLHATGKWDAAAALLSRSGSAVISNQVEIESLIQQRSAARAEITEQLHDHFEHLRHYDLVAAITALNSALDLDPENNIFGLALASLKLTQAARLDQDHIGEAYDLRMDADGRVEKYGSTWALAAARQDLLHQLRPQQVRPEPPPPHHAPDPGLGGSRRLSSVDPKPPEPSRPPEPEPQPSPVANQQRARRPFLQNRWAIPAIVAATVLVLIWGMFKFLLPSRTSVAPGPTKPIVKPKGYPSPRTPKTPDGANPPTGDPPGEGKDNPPVKSKPPTDNPGGSHIPPGGTTTENPRPQPTCSAAIDMARSQLSGAQYAKALTSVARCSGTDDGRHVVANINLGLRAETVAGTLSPAQTQELLHLSGRVGRLIDSDVKTQLARH